ncbi:MAG: AraC family transcriptional regulator [Puia sp.]|nr:AraC family transcriptional regulator [Puia sp.]
MMDDWRIVKKYNEAFLKFRQEEVIDMDKKQLPKLHFTVYRLEDRLKELNGVVPTNRESSYYIAFIRKGAGVKTIGFTRFPIVDNMLMIIPPRAIHGGAYSSPDYAGYVVGFSIEYFLDNRFPRQLITDKLIFKRSLRPYLVLDVDQGCKVQAIFEQLLQEHLHPENPHGHSEMIALRILELMITCDRLFADSNLIEEGVIYPEVVDRFNDLLEKYFSTKHSVTFYAGALNMHPNTLNSLVKKHTGRSAKDVILSRVVMEAKYYLTHSSLSVKEIAHRVGFGDPNYFSYFFRRATQQSPGDIVKLKTK